MKTFGIALVLGTLLLGACEHPDDQVAVQARRRDYVALSPLAVLVPKAKVTPSAEYVASLRAGSGVFYCDGSAMTPRYKDGTALVVEKIPFADLREGMTAVFRAPDGVVVVHYLAEKTAAGWKTIDLAPDSGNVALLTDSRYIGIVTMAFSPEED